MKNINFTKKFFINLSSFIFLILCLSFVFSNSLFSSNNVKAGQIIYGDINNDGNVNPIDVTIFSRYIANWQDVILSNPSAADTNNDGNVNPIDLTIMSRYMANWVGYETLPHVVSTATPTPTITPTPVPTEAPGARIVVSSTSGNAGDLVEVNINLVNNPGISVMRLKLDYAKNLKLISVSDSNKLGAYTHGTDLAANPYQLFWTGASSSSNNTYNGTVATLVFEIVYGDSGNNYGVNVSYVLNNYDVYDVDLNTISFDIVQGNITLTGPSATPPPVPAQLYQIAPTRTGLNMGYVIKTSHNKLIVIDGGGTEFVGYLYDELRDISKLSTPVIDAWFLTHMHNDHVDEFLSLPTGGSQNITINNVYFNFPSRNYIQTKESGAYYYLYDQLQAKYNTFYGAGAFEAINGKNIFEGDHLEIDGVSIDVLMAVTDEEILEKDINDTSLILRVTIEGQTILFLADANVREGDRLLAKYGTELKSDIVQMAHHGQNGVTEPVYQAISPTVCLWPTADWVFDNTPGTLKTMEVRQWMENLGVKYHYVTGLSGTQILTFPIKFDSLTEYDIYPG